MKIPNKRETQHIAFNHSSDIDFQDYINVYKKCTEKPYFYGYWYYSCRDNPLRFRKNLAERIQKLIMTIDDKIRGEKLQYVINREVAKISVLSSGKFDKYEYLTGEEILPSDQSRIVEEAKFTYFFFCKTFEKEIKKIEEQRKKKLKL